MIKRIAINFLSWIIILCMPGVAKVSAQIQFKVSNFSPDYYAVVEVSDTTQVFMPGSVTVFNTKTKKQLIKVESDELAFDVENNSTINANVKELPYGRQSVVIYEDFNFDGHKDLAIMNGQNSCYHGPSFNIYLAKNSGFVFSKSFTALAEEYCGMFQVDNERKRIYTMTKSGCCWHQHTTFKVVNNKPVAEEISEIGLTNSEPQFEEFTKMKINGKDTLTTQSLFMMEEGLDTVFSFELQSGKKIMLFTLNENKNLFYALLKKDGEVEFYYPKVSYNKEGEADYGKFIYDKLKNTLRFSNKGAEYIIRYSNDDVPEIFVSHKGKQVILKGVKEGMVKDIKAMPQLKIENLRVED